MQHGCWRAWDKKWWLAPGHLSKANNVESIDVFEGSDGLQNNVSVDVWGKGELDDDGMDVGGGVCLVDVGEKDGLGSFCGELMQGELDSDLHGGFLFHANVYIGVWSFPQLEDTQVRFYSH